MGRAYRLAWEIGLGHRSENLNPGAVSWTRLGLLELAVGQMAWGNGFGEWNTGVAFRKRASGLMAIGSGELALGMGPGELEPGVALWKWLGFTRE